MKFKKENKQNEVEARENTALTAVQAQKLEKACNKIEWDLKKKSTKLTWWQKIKMKFSSPETREKVAQTIQMGVYIVNMIRAYKKGEFKINKTNAIKVAVGALCMICGSKTINPLLKVLGYDAEECKKVWESSADLLKEVLSQFQNWILERKHNTNEGGSAKV